MTYCARALPSMMKRLQVALIQLEVGKSKTENLQRALSKIQEVKKQHSSIDLIALPECFNSPYGVNFFSEYAESIPNGETSKMLSKAAKDNNCFIVGGTIPEKDNNKLYNTCSVWNSDGCYVGKYRKMHLFDIDIPGKITFKESEVLSAGNDYFTFCIKDIRVGLGICYDIRFPQLATVLRQQNCELLMYPAAFNMTTGPIHWELLQRCRAVDNQLFVATISPARGCRGYIAWGHSMITTPWGKHTNLDEKEGILYQDIDFLECDQMRQQIPVWKQKRDDIYETVVKFRECKGKEEQNVK